VVKAVEKNLSSGVVTHVRHLSSAIQHGMWLFKVCVSISDVIRDQSVLLIQNKHVSNDFTRAQGKGSGHQTSVKGNFLFQQ